jgi:hypothetical protein
MVLSIKLILTFPNGAEINPFGRLGEPMTSAQYFLCRILLLLPTSLKEKINIVSLKLGWT